MPRTRLPYSTELAAADGGRRDLHPMLFPKELAGLFERVVRVAPDLDAQRRLERD